MTVLIVGGGVAGAAAACLLGKKATVIERERDAHDKVCGEFISWETQDALQCLGLDLAALGGQVIHSVRLSHGRRTVTARLPRSGISLSRRVLDEALLAEAARRGALVLRGHSVRHLSPGGAQVSGLGHVEASRTLLATGKHTMRGVNRPGPTGEGTLLGLKMYYRLAPAQSAALDGHVEVALFPGGYAGLQMVEGNRANLCLLIRQDAFQHAGAQWDGVLDHLRARCSSVADCLDGATPLLDRPLAIARIPYGFVHRPGPADPPGVSRLGDQAAVIPSFSGDGMAIALHTAFAAVRTDEAATYHSRMRADLAGQIGRAMTLHRLGLTVPGTVVQMARCWPGALALIARMTRVAGGPLHNVALAH